MATATPVSPLIDDFVVINDLSMLTLPLRPRVKHAYIESEFDSVSSDGEFEHISRPESVRSLSTIDSNTLSVCGDDDDNGDVASDCLPFLQSPDVQPGVPHIPLAVRHTPCPQRKEAHHAPLAVEHQELLPPSAGMLAPKTPQQSLSVELTQLRLPQSKCLGSDRKQNCYNHMTMDEQIISRLIDSAVNTRLEAEYGAGEPRETRLRQQMMARVRSLPAEHLVVREAMTNSRWVPALLSDQYLDVAQRKHIYVNLFTNIERIALSLLLECHKKQFNVACSFTDISEVNRPGCLCTYDHLSFTKGEQLAIEVQTACLLETDLCNIGTMLTEQQFKQEARLKIAKQATSLQNDLEHQQTSSQFLDQEVAISKLSEIKGQPLTSLEVANLTRSCHERIAMKNIFVSSLYGLLDVVSRSLFDKPCDLPSYARALKRDSSDNSLVTATLTCPPTKKLTVHGSHSDDRNCKPMDVVIPESSSTEATSLIKYYQSRLHEFHTSNTGTTRDSSRQFGHNGSSSQPPTTSRLSSEPMARVAPAIIPSYDEQLALLKERNRQRLALAHQQPVPMQAPKIHNSYFQPQTFGLALRNHRV